MKVKVWPFKPEEFVTDIATFSMLEAGVYFSLLCHMWITGAIEDPGNPGDALPHALPYSPPIKVLRLCRALRCTHEEFLECWPTISKKLTTLEDGTLVNTKLWQQREAELIRRGKEEEAGKIGAQKRWQKSAIPSPIASPMAQGIMGVNSGILYNNTIINNLDNNILSNSINKKEQKIKKEKPPQAPTFEHPELEARWQDWLTHRKQKKQACTPKAMELQVARLNSFTPEEAIKVILHSIEKNYTGLYPPSDLRPTIPGSKASKVEALKQKLGLSDNIDPNSLGRMHIFSQKQA